MKFDVVTIFPEFFAGPLHYGIVRRARESGLIDIHVHDLRQFTHDRHKTVDDRPFGGGEGMVLKPEPIFRAVETILGEDAPPNPGPDALHKRPRDTAIVLLSASGKMFAQETAQQFAKLERLVLLCGRYEGVDERVAEYLATDEISIGNFVLSGGELAAGLVIDAVTRLLPGALGNEASSVHESFSPGQKLISTGQRTQLEIGRENQLTEDGSSRHLLLDYPHYTRPADFRGWKVPEVLMSGNHEEIRRWRHRVALDKTRRNRPDLLAGTNH